MTRIPNLTRVALLCLVTAIPVPSLLAQAPARFEVTLPAGARPTTGRLFVIVARNPASDLRTQLGREPTFAIDVSQLRPGQGATIDVGALGFPLKSLNDL